MSTTTVITGSRGITQLWKEAIVEIDRLISNKNKIVIGDAPGIDSFVISYLESKGYEDVEVYYATNNGRDKVRINTKYKIIATPGGYLDRDEVMAKNADNILALWDGDSSGTRATILYFKEHIKDKTSIPNIPADKGKILIAPKNVIGNVKFGFPTKITSLAVVSNENKEAIRELFRSLIPQMKKSNGKLELWIFYEYNLLTSQVTLAYQNTRLQNFCQRIYPGCDIGLLTYHKLPDSDGRQGLHRDAKYASTKAVSLNLGKAVFLYDENEDGNPEEYVLEDGAITQFNSKIPYGIKEVLSEEGFSLILWSFSNKVEIPDENKPVENTEHNEISVPDNVMNLISKNFILYRAKVDNENEVGAAEIGRIQSQLELSIFKLSVKKTGYKKEETKIIPLQLKLVFKDNLLSMVLKKQKTKDTLMVIKEIDTQESEVIKKPQRLNPFTIDVKNENKESQIKFALDVASNTRSDGRFGFTEDGKSFGQNYYGKDEKDQWKRIIYGSILYTGAKKLIYAKLEIVIVDDEYYKNGLEVEDPVNNYTWKVGDSHAKCSSKLAKILGLYKGAGNDPSLEEGKNYEIGKLNIPVQFRAMLVNQWIAKGTIAYSPLCDKKGKDLIIPLSSLKGNKPALGNYTEKLLIGLVHEAQVRTAKPGWMYFQWMPFEALVKDKIIEELHKKCKKLANVTKDIKSLMNFLKLIPLGTPETSNPETEVPPKEKKNFDGNLTPQIREIYTHASYSNEKSGFGMVIIGEKGMIYETGIKLEETNNEVVEIKTITRILKFLLNINNQIKINQTITLISDASYFRNYINDNLVYNEKANNHIDEWSDYSTAIDEINSLEIKLKFNSDRFWGLGKNDENIYTYNQRAYEIARTHAESIETIPSLYQQKLSDKTEIIETNEDEDTDENLAALLVDDDPGDEETEGIDDEYVDIAMEIIRTGNDKLILHPYITDKLGDRVKKLWVKLCTTAGVRFKAVMCMPDEILQKKYQIKLPNGEKSVPKVCCAPDFKEGEYIVFCNPVRHWGDMQIWNNVHEGDFTKQKGIIAASRALLLSLGRDTDGDFMQLISVERYPAMAEVIRKFPPPPNTKKLPKIGRAGHIQKIGVESMLDIVGIVASMQGQAVAADLYNDMMTISGFEKTIGDTTLNIEAENMRIIDFLAQEIQIAVDSLKSAYPNNDVGLKEVREYIGKQTGQLVFKETVTNEKGETVDIYDNYPENHPSPWVKDFKSEETYKRRNCEVKEGANDTVSQIVNIVNSHWRSLNYGTELTLRQFQNVCFSEYEHSQHQLDVLIKYRNEWGQNIKLGEEKKKKFGKTDDFKNANSLLKGKKQEILNTVNPKTGDLYDANTWYRAAWFLSHNTDFKPSPDSGQKIAKGAFVFTLFGQEIVDYLFWNIGKEPPLKKMFDVYNCHKVGECCPFGKRWNGELVTCRIVHTNLGKDGAQQQGLEIIDRKETRTKPGFEYAKEFKLLGLISAGIKSSKTPLYSEGVTFQARLYYSEDLVEETGQVKQVYVFPADFWDNKDILWYYITSQSGEAGTKVGYNDHRPKINFEGHNPGWLKLMRFNNYLGWEVGTEKSHINGKSEENNPLKEGEWVVCGSYQAYPKRRDLCTYEDLKKGRYVFQSNYDYVYQKYFEMFGYERDGEGKIILDHNGNPRKRTVIHKDFENLASELRAYQKKKGQK